MAEAVDEGLSKVADVDSDEDSDVDSDEDSDVDSDEDNSVYYDWKMPLDEWLNKYSPSEILKKDEDHWIIILSQNYEADRKKRGSHDLDKLDRDWELLKQSGKPLNFTNISELGSSCGIRYGIWMIHVEIGVKVELMWKKVATHFINGALTNLASEVRVSPYDPDNPKETHVILVFNDDCMNEDKVYEVEKAIRMAGVKCELKYKPGVYSCLNIYVRNEYEIRPSIYLSQYDALKKASKIKRLWDHAFS